MTGTGGNRFEPDPTRGTRVVYLVFGSNLGDRVRAIRAGIEKLGERGVRATALSSLYESSAKYVLEQPDFLNCVGRFETTLTPGELLEVCQEVERAPQRAQQVVRDQHRWHADEVPAVGVLRDGCHGLLQPAPAVVLPVAFEVGRIVP